MRGKKKLLHSVIIALMVFGILFFSSVRLFDYVRTTSEAEQLQMVSEAVHQALMTCYAVEGAYPPKLSYLEDNYGLSWDHERVHVAYDAFASNIMPSVQVRKRGDDQP